MLKLVKLQREHMPLLIDMMDEWTASGEDITPWSISQHGKLDYHDFDAYAQAIDVREASADLVPGFTYFALDEERKLFVGAVNIRPELNERLLLSGGHIGDGVRPSERGKGYATRMIALALEKCREMGIGRVLMVCDKENIASARTIQKNGGVLENEVMVDGEIEQRYWIERT